MQLYTSKLNILNKNLFYHRYHFQAIFHARDIYNKYVCNFLEKFLCFLFDLSIDSIYIYNMLLENGQLILSFKKIPDIYVPVNA